MIQQSSHFVQHFTQKLPLKLQKIKIKRNAIAQYVASEFVERKHFHSFPESCRTLRRRIIAGVYVNKQATFTIDARDVAKSKTDDGKVSCTINNPSGGKTEKLITPQGDGTYRVSYTPFEEGCHTIDILYDNVPIPGSPFSVNVQRGSNPSKCRAYGPGLERGIVNKTNRFTVETRGQ